MLGEACDTEIHEVTPELETVLDEMVKVCEKMMKEATGQDFNMCVIAVREVESDREGYKRQEVKANVCGEYGLRAMAQVLENQGIKVMTRERVLGGLSRLLDDLAAHADDSEKNETQG